MMIFLSYSWSQSDYADKMVSFFMKHHIELLRDKSEIKKGDSISDFMERINTADFAILLISKNYLQSFNCMKELYCAFKNNRSGIIPVVFRDAEVFDDEKRIEYISFWEAQKDKLIQRSKTISPYMASKLHKKIHLVDQYTDFLDDCLSYLQETNCILVEKDLSLNYSRRYGTEPARCHA